MDFTFLRHLLDRPSASRYARQAAPMFTEFNLGAPPRPGNKTPSSPAARATLRGSAWHRASGMRLLRRHHVSALEARHARVL